jgi:hypothetical protein
LPPAPSPPHFFRQRQLLPAAFAAATPLSMNADIAIITPLLIFAIYFRMPFSLMLPFSMRHRYDAIRFGWLILLLRHYFIIFFPLFSLLSLRRHLFSFTFTRYAAIDTPLLFSIFISLSPFFISRFSLFSSPLPLAFDTLSQYCCYFRYYYIDIIIIFAIFRFHFIIISLRFFHIISLIFRHYSLFSLVFIDTPLLSSLRRRHFHTFHYAFIAAYYYFSLSLPFISHFDCCRHYYTLFIFIIFHAASRRAARFSPGAASPPLMPLPIADMALCAVFAASMMPPLPARAADYYAATFSRFLADALSFSLPVFAAFSFSHFTPPSAPPCDFHV